MNTKTIVITIKYEDEKLKSVAKDTFTVKEPKKDKASAGFIHQGGNKE